MADAAASTPEVITPIVIDLGKKRRKRIRNLKKGRGRLMDQVAEVVQEVHQSLGEGAEGKELVPIVMVYRRQRKKKNYGLFPFLG